MRGEGKSRNYQVDAEAMMAMKKGIADTAGSSLGRRQADRQRGRQTDQEACCMIRRR